MKTRHQKSLKRKANLLKDESMWAINYGDWNKNVFLAQQFGLGIHDDMMTFAKENKTFFPNLMKVEHAFLWVKNLSFNMNNWWGDDNKGFELWVWVAL